MAVSQRWYCCCHGAVLSLILIGLASATYEKDKIYDPNSFNPSTTKRVPTYTVLRHHDDSLYHEQSEIYPSSEIDPSGIHQDDLTSKLIDSLSSSDGDRNTEKTYSQSPEYVEKEPFESKQSEANKNSKEEDVEEEKHKSKGTYYGDNEKNSNSNEDKGRRESSGENHRDDEKVSDESKETDEEDKKSEDKIHDHIHSSNVENHNGNDDSDWDKITPEDLDYPLDSQKMYDRYDDDSEHHRGEGSKNEHDDGDKHSAHDGDSNKSHKGRKHTSNPTLSSVADDVNDELKEYRFGEYSPTYTENDVDMGDRRSIKKDNGDIYQKMKAALTEDSQMIKDEIGSLHEQDNLLVGKLMGETATRTKEVTGTRKASISNTTSNIVDDGDDDIDMDKVTSELLNINIRADGKIVDDNIQKSDSKEAVLFRGLNKESIKNNLDMTSKLHHTETENTDVPVKYKDVTLINNKDVHKDVKILNNDGEDTMDDVAKLQNDVIHTVSNVNAEKKSFSSRLFSKKGPFSDILYNSTLHQALLIDSSAPLSKKSADIKSKHARSLSNATDTEGKHFEDKSSVFQQFLNNSPDNLAKKKTFNTSGDYDSSPMDDIDIFQKVRLNNQISSKKTIFQPTKNETPSTDIGILKGTLQHEGIENQNLTLKESGKSQQQTSKDSSRAGTKKAMFAAVYDRNTSFHKPIVSAKKSYTSGENTILKEMFQHSTQRLPGQQRSTKSLKKSRVSPLYTNHPQSSRIAKGHHIKDELVKRDSIDESGGGFAGAISYTDAKGHEMTYTISKDKLTYDEARRRCQLHHGDLASIADGKEQEFIATNVILEPNEYWIGLDDQVNEGEFEWVDRTPYAYSHWSNLEPDDGTLGGSDETKNEDCTIIKPTMDWSDVKCNNKYKFICKATSNDPVTHRPVYSNRVAKVSIIKSNEDASTEIQKAISFTDGVNENGMNNMNKDNNNKIADNKDNDNSKANPSIRHISPKSTSSSSWYITNSNDEKPMAPKIKNEDSALTAIDSKPTTVSTIMSDVATVVPKSKQTANEVVPGGNGGKSVESQTISEGQNLTANLHPIHSPLKHLAPSSAKLEKSPGQHSQQQLLQLMKQQEQYKQQLLLESKLAHEQQLLFLQQQMRQLGQQSPLNVDENVENMLTNLLDSYNPVSKTNTPTDSSQKDNSSTKAEVVLKKKFVPDFDNVREICKQTCSDRMSCNLGCAKTLLAMNPAEFFKVLQSSGQSSNKYQKKEIADKKDGSSYDPSHENTMKQDQPINEKLIESMGKKLTAKFKDLLEKSGYNNGGMLGSLLNQANDAFTEIKNQQHKEQNEIFQRFMPTTPVAGTAESVMSGSRSTEFPTVNQEEIPLSHKTDNQMMYRQGDLMNDHQGDQINNHHLLSNYPMSEQNINEQPIISEHGKENVLEQQGKQGNFFDNLNREHYQNPVYTEKSSNFLPNQIQPFSTSRNNDPNFDLPIPSVVPDSSISLPDQKVGFTSREGFNTGASHGFVNLNINNQHEIPMIQDNIPIQHKSMYQNKILHENEPQQDILADHYRQENTFLDQASQDNIPFQYKGMYQNNNLRESEPHQHFLAEHIRQGNTLFDHQASLSVKSKPEGINLEEKGHGIYPEGINMGVGYQPPQIYTIDGENRHHDVTGENNLNERRNSEFNEFHQIDHEYNMNHIPLPDMIAKTFQKHQIAKSRNIHRPLVPILFHGSGTNHNLHKALAPITFHDGNNFRPNLPQATGGKRSRNNYVHRSENKDHLRNARHEPKDTKKKPKTNLEKYLISKARAKEEHEMDENNRNEQDEKIDADLEEGNKKISQFIQNLPPYFDHSNKKVKNTYESHIKFRDKNARSNREKEISEDDENYKEATDEKSNDRKSSRRNPKKRKKYTNVRTEDRKAYKNQNNDEGNESTENVRNNQDADEGYNEDDSWVDNEEKEDSNEDDGDDDTDDDDEAGSIQNSNIDHLNTDKERTDDDLTNYQDDINGYDVQINDITPTRRSQNQGFGRPNLRAYNNNRGHSNHTKIKPNKETSKLSKNDKEESLVTSKLVKEPDKQNFKYVSGQRLKKWNMKERMMLLEKQKKLKSLRDKLLSYQNYLRPDSAVTPNKRDVTYIGDTIPWKNPY